jgi:uncharacterized protein (DUF488 family)
MARFPRHSRRVTIFTIGHSTRRPEELLSLLLASGVRRLVDVRRYPGSRRYPHFGQAALQQSLAEHGISYVHEPALGGRRAPAPDSVNRAWRSASFRGYADYMATAEFLHALRRTLAGADADPTALMCAEAVPWRCHRQLIADAIVARGVEVRHIIGPTPPAVHVLNPAARVGAQQVLTYPDADTLQERLL